MVVVEWYQKISTKKRTMYSRYKTGEDATQHLHFTYLRDFLPLIPGLVYYLHKTWGYGCGIWILFAPLGSCLKKVNKMLLKVWKGAPFPLCRLSPLLLPCYIQYHVVPLMSSAYIFSAAATVATVDAVTDTATIPLWLKFLISRQRQRDSHNHDTDTKN